MSNYELTIPAHNRARLAAATAGLDLTDQEQSVLDWLAAIWEIEICDAVASVLDKARGAAPDALVYTYHGQVSVRVPDCDDPGLVGGVYLNGSCIDYGESRYSAADARQAAAALLRAAQLAEDGYGWIGQDDQGSWRCVRWLDVGEIWAGSDGRCGQLIGEGRRIGEPGACPRHGTRPPVGPGFADRR